MARITMRNSQKATFAEVFEVYISAVTARGVKDKTIATYKQHFHAISKRLDVSMPINRLTSTALDSMILQMRKEGLSDSSINSYTRTLKCFLSWCNEEGYLKEQWPYLTNYLKDGRLEISNNRAERSIKPFVIDRKNFLFANTPKRATGSAVMFSLIQTAMENSLDPYNYLTWLLRKARDADLTDAETVQSLLPWNAVAECQTK